MGNNTLDYINREKDNYGKMFVDVSYAIDNISPFLDQKELNRRKYVSKLPILKRYMDLLNAAEVEKKKNSGFMGMFKSDNTISLLEDYKRSNSESLSQLSKCTSCACLNCTSICKFDSCLGCRKNSRIAYCDHNKYNLTVHDNYTLNLTNNGTGRENTYKVLATIQDCELNRKYIIIENIYNSEDKFILYYYPQISGDDQFGEITDGAEFDAIVELFQSVSL